MKRLYSEISFVRIIATGTMQSEISTEITARYPCLQLHAGRVAPTISYPMALPAEPVPSIIPVIVEIAFSLPYIADCLPRSAAHTEEMMLFKELMKKPSPKSIRSNTA